MKNIRVFLFENFPFLEMKFSIYLNRRVFVMVTMLKRLNFNKVLWHIHVLYVSFHNLVNLTHN